MPSVSDRLPTFPWDRLEPYKTTAAGHPDGLVDLSVGTPVDPVPAQVRQALAEAADSPGYPTVWGTRELRDALTGWCERRLGARGITEHHVLPVVGSKELVAWLPTQLGLGPGDRVAFPRLAYPTYEVGARLAGADHVAYDDPLELDPAGLKLLWLNSPSNPTGQVLPAERLRAVVDWAREHGVLVLSDECYLELGWEADPVSVLHPDVCGGSTHRGPGGRPLALQALQPRRIPGRVHRGGQRGAGRAAADPQARRDDDARAGAGGDGRGAGRRHPRGRAAGALPGAAHRAAGRAGGRGLPDRAQRGVAVPVGDPGTSPAGTPSPSWPRGASWWRPASSTDPRGSGTSGSRSRPRTSGSPPRCAGCPRSGPRVPGRSRGPGRLRCAHPGPAASVRAPGGSGPGAHTAKGRPDRAVRAARSGHRLRALRNGVPERCPAGERASGRRGRTVGAPRSGDRGALNRGEGHRGCRRTEGRCPPPRRRCRPAGRRPRPPRSRRGSARRVPRSGRPCPRPCRRSARPS